MKSYKNMTPKGGRRMPFDAEPMLADQIEDFRHENRITTTAGAVRELVRRGLERSRPREVIEPGAVEDMVSPAIQPSPYRPLSSRVAVKVDIGKRPEHDLPWPGVRGFSGHGDKQLNHRIAASVVDQISWLAKRHGLTAKDVVETALRDCLDQELPLLGLHRVD